MWVPQTPHFALLNVPVDRISNSLQRLIFYILLGARITIANSWKQPSVSLTQAKKKKYESCYMKIIFVFYRVRLKDLKRPGNCRLDICMFCLKHNEYFWTWGVRVPTVIRPVIIPLSCTFLFSPFLLRLSWLSGLLIAFRVHLAGGTSFSSYCTDYCSFSGTG